MASSEKPYDSVEELSNNTFLNLEHLFRNAFSPREVYGDTCHRHDPAPYN